ncbi:hypothetical protein HZ326_26736, partial [Fusarium oxysporum f. sp. albedinis]
MQRTATIQVFPLLASAGNRFCKDSRVSQTGVLTASSKLHPNFSLPHLSLVTSNMPQSSYTEDDVIQAILDVTENGLSQNQAAQKNGVPPTTLSDRLRGLPSKSEVTQPAQLLSKSEESRLVTWILRQEALGYAPSHSQVRATVAALLRQQGRERPIGVHWLARFIKRHDDIKTKVGKRQEAARFNCFTPTAVNWYFDIRESEYGWIKPENTVNVDEGGIMAGFGLDSLVIGSSDPRRKAFLKGSHRGLSSKVKSFSNSGLSTSSGGSPTGIISRPTMAGRTTISQSSGSRRSICLKRN